MVLAVYYGEKHPDLICSTRRSPWARSTREHICYKHIPLKAIFHPSNSTAGVPEPQEPARHWPPATHLKTSFELSTTARRCRPTPPPTQPQRRHPPSRTPVPSQHTPPDTPHDGGSPSRAARRAPRARPPRAAGPRAHGAVVLDQQHTRQQRQRQHPFGGAGVGRGQAAVGVHPPRDAGAVLAGAAQGPAAVGVDDERGPEEAGQVLREVPGVAGPAARGAEVVGGHA